jgi:hypothetical protein
MAAEPSGSVPGIAESASEKIITARPDAGARVPMPSFHGSYAAVPADLAERMRKFSWRKGCPVPIEDLAYLRISHYGFDGAVHRGELVVHRALAVEVLDIFKALFAQRFPVEKMRPIESYGGDDDRSMDDDNTSGFNCRDVAGRPGVLSKHSHGRAIDVNPLRNPMVVGDKVSPPAGAKFADRGKHVPGTLNPGDAAVREFTRRGWTWGGSWTSMKDYQHFEK